MTLCSPPVRLLDRQTVSELLTLDDCIKAVEEAFLAHAERRSLRPQLIHVDADGGEFHIKAGGLRGARTYFVCKVNGGFFANRTKLGLPNIVGLILLADGASGIPLALMESGLLTSLRTAAATAVAAKYLARCESQVVTICGAGVQAEVQLRALTRVLPIQRAWVWSRRDATAFCRRMSNALELEVRPQADLQTAAHQSDIIVTCTPAKHWFLGRQHVVPGTFVAAVGADSPDKQEVEPELLAMTSVVCDLTAQCAEVGELHHAIAAGLIREPEVRGELGEVIAGKAPKRIRDDEIIIFDSTGTALQDAAAAAVLYERAEAEPRGQSFAFENP
jgi:alanine dehydrogenase